MTSYGVPVGPGKLPSRLWKDLLDYDPRHSESFTYNLLRDPPPRHKNGLPPPSRRKPGRDCQHNLVRKDKQCVDLPQQEQPKTGNVFKLAAFCTKCFYHFDIILSLESYSHLDDYNMDNVCSKDDKTFLTHHFQNVAFEKHTQGGTDQSDSPESRFDTWIERYEWACSAPRCPANLKIQISPPRLDAQKKKLLADRTVLKLRGEYMIAKQADRFAVIPGQPEVKSVLANESLGILKQYLTDASTTGAGGKPRRVAARNKRFVLAFADDCSEILQWLGFTPEHEQDPDNNGTNLFWVLPYLAGLELDTIDIAKNNRHLVDDVQYELSQMINDLSPEDQVLKYRPVWTPTPAINSFHAFMGTNAIKTQSIDLEAQEHPPVAVLGATSDLADKAIAFAYERQKTCDPQHTPHYFEALKNIATSRDSEELSFETSLEQSNGLHTQTEIDSAYDFFKLDETSTYDHIIGVYQSRIEAAPRQLEQAKECLRTIGFARSSHNIIELANAKEMTVQEAREFLGIQGNPNPDIEDIRAAATVIVSNSYHLPFQLLSNHQILDGDKDKVVKAVKTLAEFKDDFALKLLANDLQSGDKPGISSDDAYKALQLPNKTVPDETVIAYFTSLWDENGSSGSKESFVQALTFIANERDSSLLKAKAKTPSGELAIPKAEPNQPVGLANIGNTCYLNSLLQYFYTVKAVRDVVMEFDSFKMEITEESVAKKRVGGRAVKRHEIVRAQKFVELLAGLYGQLKTASTQSVKPTQDLAEMTLYSAEADEMFRRGSMSGVPANTMSIAAVVSGEVESPNRAPPYAPTVEATDIDMIDAPNTESYREEDLVQSTEHDDTISDATLVEHETRSVGSPSKGDLMMADADKSHMESIDPAKLVLSKDPKISVIELDNASQEADTNFLDAEITSEIPAQNQPGPIVTIGEVTNNKSQKLELGAQQDVTEVIGNLMFNLQCAIQPSRIDDTSGEQGDIIRDTFYGSTATHTQKGATTEFGNKVEFWSNLIVYPSLDGSRTIYEALDVQFDEQKVQLDSAEVLQYAAINELPPVLQIQIQRTDYDKVSNRAVKNQNRVEFSETIYLDRYMNNDKVLPRRKESNKRKVRLAELNQQQKAIEAHDGSLSKQEVFTASKDFLRSIQEEEGFDNDLPDVLEDRLASTSRQLTQIEQEKSILKDQLKEDFTDMREYKYVLQAVFMHRGNSIGGHHWVYIYDFKNNVWREYNDERVEIVRDLQSVYGHRADDPRPATAHYLVYVREDKKDDLVDAVWRETEVMEMMEAPERQPHFISEADMTDAPEDSEVAISLDRWEADAMEMSRNDNEEGNH